MYLEAIREALLEEMQRDAKVFVLGEDVGPYGGAFGATQGLCEQFGEARVIDRGPGIATELRERLFERFVRGDSGDDQTQSSGTGLGLAIVKGLVEAHAGSVALELSPNGVGAVFKFTLPLAPALPS